jgi:hypothetical protein
LQRRCDRNRKRSKRRAIYCPNHSCYLDSVSQKYSIYTDQAAQLQQRGIGKRNALMLTASQATVVLSNEWLEAFWCAQCQQTKWYYVRKVDRTYNISVAPQEIWQQAIGVTNPGGNPSVGEFTLRHARMNSYDTCKQFKFMD